jgi:putative RNA 2'-phosphotransferase
MQYKAILKGTWQYPDYLFHLTREEFTQSILEKGLLPGKRLYVHLYYFSDYEVLPRQKADEIWLEVNTELLKTDLYNSCGRIYLAKCVPSQAIKILGKVYE